MADRATETNSAKKADNESKTSNKEKIKIKPVGGRAGTLAYLISSSSENEQEPEQDDTQLIDILRKAMTAYTELLTEHAEMSKACCSLAHLPDKDSKARDTVTTLTPLYTKARLAELIQINDDMVNEIHDQGLGDQIFGDNLKSE